MKRTYFAPLLLALVALVLTACGAGPQDEVSGEPVAPIEPVESPATNDVERALDPEVLSAFTAAAATTAELGSVRMDLAISMEAPGLEGGFELAATGEFDLGGSSETRSACIHVGLLVGALSGYPRIRQFLPTVGAKRHLFLWGLEGLGLGVSQVDLRDHQYSGCSLMIAKMRSTSALSLPSSGLL